MIPDTERCCEEVSNSPIPGFHRCRRNGTVKRGKQKYCRQHDPVAVAEKRAARDKKWEHGSAIADLQRELGSAAAEIVKAVVQSLHTGHVAELRQRYIDLQAQLNALLERGA